MAQTNDTAPAALLDKPMHTLYNLLGQLVASGLTPNEARSTLRTMVARVLAVHPTTATAPGVNE